MHTRRISGTAGRAERWRWAEWAVRADARVSVFQDQAGEMAEILGAVRKLREVEDGFRAVPAVRWWRTTEPGEVNWRPYFGRWMPERKRRPALWPFGPRVSSGKLP